MAENSKRKPRKSKLVLRDCDLDDDKSDETKVFLFYMTTILKSSDYPFYFMLR